MRLVAAAHDTSIGMIEKHYAAFIVDATEDLMRRSAVALAPADMVPLRVAAAENRPTGPVRQSAAAAGKPENKATAQPKMAKPEGAKLTQGTRPKSRRK